MTPEPPDKPSANDPTPIGQGTTSRDVRQAEQEALRAEHQELSALMRDITDRFQRLEREEPGENSEFRARMVALLKEEMQLLERARLLDAGLRGLFGSRRANQRAPRP